MRLRRIVLSLVLVLLGVVLLGQGRDVEAPAERADEAAPIAAVRFMAFDVYVDPAGLPLAAWQIDVKADAANNAGTIRVVGIEGGEHEAYRRPPYYDPRAIEHDRVIIGAFSTAADVPAGRTRVARIHVRAEGPADWTPEFDVALEAAARVDGGAIEATVQIEQGVEP